MQGMYAIDGQIRAKMEREGVEFTLEGWQKEMQSVLTTEWAIGFRDRGHGHGDFAVITKVPEDDVIDGQIVMYYPLQIFESPTREFAEHVVNLHNASLK